MALGLVKDNLLQDGRAAQLQKRAYIVITCMTAYALDRPSREGRPARLYYGGWEPLARALGYEIDPRAEADDPEVEQARLVKERRAAKRQVGKAVKELVDGGLVERLIDEKKVHAGTRQTYRVKVERRNKRGSKADPHRETKPDPQEGVQTGTKWEAGADSPRSTQDKEQVVSEIEDPSIQVRASTTDRARGEKDGSEFEDERAHDEQQEQLDSAPGRTAYQTERQRQRTRKTA